MKIPYQGKEPKKNVDLETMERKLDHINLAVHSQTTAHELDNRFFYEPMMAAFPKSDPEPIPFAGKMMKVPIWVSSMTGGHALSGTINRNLAMACHEFGLGMGLGSCRGLLADETLFEDFNMRPIIGDNSPFFANLGIAQVEELLEKKETDSLRRLVDRLKADGLIIHVNPLQEWIQPEGNIIRHAPVETIEKLLELIDFKLIVKEVGQGFGPKSLGRLLQLPLSAIEFGAFGGTNFSKVENNRVRSFRSQKSQPFVNVGVTAEEMVDIINNLTLSGYTFACNQLIISGGIRNYLDGYYLIQKSLVPAIYAQASLFLQHSRGAYDELRQFIVDQIEGYHMAKSYLTLRDQPIKSAH
jgi:isopentenyl-diphosphate delta-isomerase